MENDAQNCESGSRKVAHGQERHISDSLMIDAIEVVDEGATDLLAIIKKVTPQR